MTAHLHSGVVEDCYRCEVGYVPAVDALLDAMFSELGPMCPSLEAIEATVQHLRSLPVEQRMEAMGMVEHDLFWSMPRTYRIWVEETYADE